MYLFSCPKMGIKHNKPKSQHKSLRGIRLISSMFMTLCLFTLCTWSTSWGRSPLGVGLMIGTPSGLTAQLKLGSHSALNMSLNYDLSNEWILTGGDLRWVSISGDRGHLHGYFGVGGQIRLGSRYAHESSHILGRIPFGLEYQQTQSPWLFFIEIVPTLGLLPSLDIGAQGGFGFRYFF